MPRDNDRPELTEAEYETWVRQRLAAEMNRLNEHFGHLLPDGVRFEWVPPDAVG